MMRNQHFLQSLDPTYSIDGNMSAEEEDNHLHVGEDPSDSMEIYVISEEEEDFQIKEEEVPCFYPGEGNMKPEEEEETLQISADYGDCINENEKAEEEEYSLQIGADPGEGKMKSEEEEVPLQITIGEDGIEEKAQAGEGEAPLQIMIDQNILEMGRKRKRKVDHECRVFNTDWGVKYFFVASGDKALCVICGKTVAVLKEYNIRRHYEAFHQSIFSEFTGLLRLQKFELMQSCVMPQQCVIRQRSENEALTTASYKVAYILAKRGKPFSDGGFIKECLTEVAEELCPEKADLFRTLSLAPNTVARRVEAIGHNIIDQIVDKAKSFQAYSLALYETTDASEKSQLLVFIRGVDSDFNVIQELASMHNLTSTKTVDDLFKELQKTLSEYNLEWNKLQCVTVDGGKNMSGLKTGLIEQIARACEAGGFSVPMFLHCLIHQQAMCGKYVDMSCVLKQVVSTLNFIRSHGQVHSQFRDFLKETHSEIADLTNYTTVPWLSCEKVLSQFFQLRKDIDSLMTEKGRPSEHLSDSEWLWKLAFFADLSAHMTQFNVKLQGEANLICDLYSYVKAFRAKLALFLLQLKAENFVHFPLCQTLLTEGEEDFPALDATKVISDLQKQFQERFSDLDTNAEEIRLFQNPFTCKVENVQSRLQMEIIDLQSDDRLKDLYKGATLMEFYKALSPEQFPNLKQFACGFVSVFGTTNLCEQTFSRVKSVKSSYRGSLSNERLQSILIINSTNLKPQFNNLLKLNKQFHHSH